MGVTGCFLGTHTGLFTSFTGKNEVVCMIWSPDSWGWVHVKAYKYVDNTKIKDITQLKALSYSINKPCQQLWTLNVKFDKTLTDRMNSPHKVSSASNHLHSSVIFHFGVHLHLGVKSQMHRDHVILRDMISQLPCYGPCMVRPCCSCMRACA